MTFRLDRGPRRVERDVDEEIAFHLGERERALVSRGEDPTLARAAALERFGDLSAIRGACLAIDYDRDRAMRQADFFLHLRQDVHYGVRTLLHNKLFAAVVLLILTLGIGANTATFTLIDALMLRPLPVPHPEQLVTVGDPKRTGGLSQGAPSTTIESYPVYKDVRDQNHVFAGIYATGRSERLDVVVATAGAAGAPSRDEAEHPHGRYVSGNFFSVLGVGTAAGRTFASDEDQVPGASPVVVISYAYWQRRFAGDGSALGRVIVVNGVPLTIIGVAPRGFFGDVVGQAPDFWIPVTMEPTLEPHSPWLDDRTTNWLLFMGRLRSGVTLAQAKLETAALVHRSLLDHATAANVQSVQREIRTRPAMIVAGAMGFSYYRGVYAAPLVTLMGVVGLVLLIACANVANLLLARAAARGREIGVRIALGAGRARLVQQLLTESVVLAAIGAGLSLILAMAGSTVLLRLASTNQPIPLALHLDGRVLGFTAGVSLLTAVLFGLVPALRATRQDVANTIRSGGRGIAQGRMPMGRWLVVVQVALSMLLLVGAGMLVRSTIRLANADVGVARDGLLIARIDAGRSGYEGPKFNALLRDLIARVQQVPGVAAVTASENGIFSGTESGSTMQVEGYVAHADSDTLVASDVVGPHYFRSIGAHILQGRDIEPRDNETGAKVVVFNQTMARFFFPNGDAIGHHVQLDSASKPEIVGIVGDIQENGVREPPVRRLYMPVLQMPNSPAGVNLEIRTTGDPARLAIAVRRALAAAGPSLIVLDVEPLTDLIRDSISQDRLVATMVSFFGILALVLAALGLYGVMAYSTARRTGEFGLRMALGAAPGAVTRMVLREAILLTGIGMAVGIPVAIAGARLVKGQLFGIGLFDPPSIGLATVVLAASAALAGYLPALRASRVAPLVAIRAE